MSIRLVVVDGHTLIRYGLRCLVEQQQDIELLGECPTGAGAADLVTEVGPDVVTIDVALPDGNGLALARDLRDRFASLGIVMLTSYGEDEVMFRALETGVSAFVSKTAPIEEILGAIRHAAVAASSFTAAGLAGALARRRDASERLALSPREREVLRLLQDGLSIPAIARTMYVSQSTAKTYVARLYEKLGASSRAQALMTALQLGLIQYQSGVQLRNGQGSTTTAQTAAQTAAPTAAQTAAQTAAPTAGQSAGQSAGQGADPSPLRTRNATVRNVP